MTEINKAGETNSLGHIDIPQGQYRSQIDALTDAVRQLGGKAEIAPGSSVVNDPLNAPYILYVNSYTGSDKFVAGEYASADDGTFEQKMRRISQQRLECGYTEARPFKTINRAAIEAGIITSKAYLNLSGNLCGDLVTIVVQSGVHDVINGPGTGTTPKWADGYEPTAAELQKFNAADGGVILPRGCSVVSMDLRKTNLRPVYVPAFDQENADYSNRSSIFRVTGTGYYYGFTFLDKKNYTQSHHLLDTFSFAGRARTDAFYAKILASFGASSGISTLARTRNSEVQIVGPQPDPGKQSQTTDTVESASPYIYNCSIRSTYGLCGIFADGADVEGFKSMVVAQYTAISMQKDMRCWQRYVSGAWSTINQSDYNKYIDETPDNVRMDPRYRSIHIRCVNRAIIQEVSVFAIGQGVHHAVSSGGELTVTNSNSNFGGVCALADGFVDYSFKTDKSWNVSRIKVSEDLTPLKNRIQTYFLGTVKTVSNGGKKITLEVNLAGEENNEPTLLSADGFSLNNYGDDSYIWIENPNNLDYYAPLANTAWAVSNKDEINVSTAFLSADGDQPVGTDLAGPYPPLPGNRIYVRRLRDIRRPEQRQYSLVCNNTDANSRNIVRDYGLQTDTSDSAIDKEIKDTEALVAASIAVKPANVAGVKRQNEIELRRACASKQWDKSGAYLGTDDSGSGGYHQTYNYYRAGDVIRYANKHYKCTKDHFATAAAPDSKKFDEVFVHMEEEYAAEDFFKNSKPVIIFDKDLDNTTKDDLLGYSNASFENDDEIKAQYRTATDYLGIFSFLVSLGFNKNEAHKILLPKPEADRERDPGTQLDSIGAPSGAANSWDNWVIQFRRPSNIRLFGHAFEWAGQLNYTKALPQYQRDLSASNKFSYFFTNSMGGRCYVSGFNEEGFGVSAAGLTDLQTGELLSPEGLGSDELDSNKPVVFNGDVTVGGTLTANNIDSTQVSLVKDRDNKDVNPPKNNNDLVSQGRGMCWIAPTKTIVDVTDVEAETFDKTNEIGQESGPRNVKGYTGPSFVTPYYLDTWRAKNRLLGSQEGPVIIFVNPRAVDKPANSDRYDAGQLQSSNWDATSIQQMIGNPPTSRESAAPTFRLAIEYANATISKTTPVHYYLGTGIYSKDTGSLIFEHDCLLIGFDIATNNFVTDGEGGGEHAWLGTVQSGRGTAGNLGKFPESGLAGRVKDATKMPVFLTKLSNSVVNNKTQNRITFRPLKCVFRQPATLQGITWWGVTETLKAAQGTDSASPNRVPNEFFDQLDDSAKLEVIKSQSEDKILNAAVYQLLAGNNFHYMYTDNCISTGAALFTRDVLITAIGLPYTRGGKGTDHCVIEGVNNATFQLSGLTLLGNNMLDGSGYSGFTGTAPQFAGKTGYRFFGFCTYLFGSTATSANSSMTFGFCRYGRYIVEGTSDRNYNLTQWNNHLLTRDYKYPDLSSDIGNGANPTNNEAGRNKQGPAFRAILGRNVRFRRTMSSSYQSYRAGGTNRKPGFAGAFGFGIIFPNTGTAYPDNYLATTLSSNEDKDARSKTEASGQPDQNIQAGSVWEYSRGPVFFNRNGEDVPSKISGAPSFGGAPRILSRQYTYGNETATRLNVKYAIVKLGLDYEQNYKSNRDVYG